MKIHKIHVESLMAVAWISIEKFLLGDRDKTNRVLEDEAEWYKSERQHFSYTHKAYSSFSH